MLTNHCIIKHCSDQTYKGTMALVRQLVVSCLSFNMYLKAKHLTLKINYVVCFLFFRNIQVDTRCEQNPGFQFDCVNFIYGGRLGS